MRNNTTKMVVKVEDIIVAAPHKDALEKMVWDIDKLGYGPSTIAHGANSIPDAVKWIRDTVTLAPNHELVAFKISTKPGFQRFEIFKISNVRNIQKFKVSNI